MNNHTKGLLYEKYVRYFIINNLNKNAYLWNECPEDLLIEKKLINSHNDMRILRKDLRDDCLHNHKDIGIDIIQIDDTDNFSIIQCKNGYDNGLCVKHISGIMMRCAFIRNANTFIYYTDSLSRNIKYTAIISPYVVNIDCSDTNDELLKIENDNRIYFVKLPYINEHKPDKTEMIIPYNYQKEAVDKFIDYYKTNNRGILSLPCGTGKTYTSYLISANYNHIIIISPLREFANQNLKKFIEYGYDKTNTILVDADGIRNLDYIKNFIRSHNKLLISCTYQSMDLISECLDLFKEELFIIDEFHNLSKANITDENNDIYKLLISKQRILFMSATPRIYDIEYDEDNDYDINSIFGSVVYNMTINEAIENRYITNYRIWLPSIHENNEELDSELSIYEIDEILKNRCKFLYSCILNNGSRKCIIYCKDTNDMKEMIDCMKSLNDFYVMDIEMNSIACDDSETKRRGVLESFSNNNDKVQLLFNIRILNECIDIPSCDSIYISYPPKNKITTIQRLSRATRINKENPYKIANVYIWCDDYEEILETLSSIKEYDLMFKDKIKINPINFYNSNSTTDLELVKNDIKLISDYIIGIKEFKQYSWEEKLQMVEDYIKEYGQLPNKMNKNNIIHTLGIWLANQKQNYKNNKEIMKNKKIKAKWENFINEYEKFFKTNQEIWYDNLNSIKEYIKKNNKLPSKKNKNKEIHTLGVWLINQKANYKNNKEIMKNEEIKSIWEEFIITYEVLFKTNEEIWYDKLDNIKEYIKKYNKLPCYNDSNANIKSLGKWLSHQKDNYKKNIKNMKNEEIKRIWEVFTNKYKVLFVNNKEKWYDTLQVITEYIKNNNLKHSLKNNKSLENWLSTQKHNYKKNEGIMKDTEIRNKWEEFINTHKELFK